ncbi:MAG: hypothetical protein K8S24_12390 [Candidatus Aegiribacteria sp.]|nr:hypothetical protein [Candidatus Aegiribacteria sp.]
MTISLLIAFCITTGYTVPAEPPEVLEIREHYGEIREQMDDEHGFYRTVIDINPTDVPFPAVGHYREQITFYWTLDEEYGTYKLLFVTISGEHAANTDYTEILYDYDGEAVFTLFSFINPNGILEETRRWFSGGEEIHATCRIVSEDATEYLSPSERESNFMRDPETLMETFRMI